MAGKKRGDPTIKAKLHERSEGKAKPKTQSTVKQSAAANFSDSAELAVLSAFTAVKEPVAPTIPVSANYAHTVSPPAPSHLSTSFSYQGNDPFDPSVPQQESSIPLGAFADATEGLQPRSRMADTREAYSREKIDFIERAFKNVAGRNKGLLDVDEDMIPEGFTFLWARASVRDHPDASNLRSLQKKGWLFAGADQMPGLAFYDSMHGIRDDAEHIYNDGLVAMLRYKEITEYEDKHHLKASREQTNSLASYMRRKDNNEINPFISMHRNTPFQNDLGNPFGDSAAIGQDFSQNAAYY